MTVIIKAIFILLLQIIIFYNGFSCLSDCISDMCDSYDRIRSVTYKTYGFMVWDCQCVLCHNDCLMQKTDNRGLCDGGESGEKP